MDKRILQSLFILIMVIAAGCGKGSGRQTIVYRVEMPKTDPAYFFVGNMKVSIYGENGKVASDWRSQFLTIKTVITDRGTITLTSAMGDKLVARTPSPASSSKPLPYIRYTDETKVIAGYKCVKVIVKSPGEDSSTMWCATNLPPMAFTENAWFFKSLKGMPLEVTIRKNRMNLTLVAEKVSTGVIPDSVFHPSTAGFTEMKDYMEERIR